MGNLEISKLHNDVYNTNHSPKYSYTMDIRDFNKLHNLPAELYNLDVLDGSAHCFSISNQKKLKETLEMPVEDYVHFELIKLAKKLQPKVIIAGAAIGALKGKSKYYSIRMIEELQNIGYKVQLFRLNAATMGVPQHTQRLFFICHRTDLNWPDLKLEFNEKPIAFSRIKCKNAKPNLPASKQILWENRQDGDRAILQIRQRLGQPAGYYNGSIVYDNKPLPCLTNHASEHLLFSEPRTLTQREIKLGTSFPQDFECPTRKTIPLINISTPPIMLHRILEQIYRQWLE